MAEFENRLSRCFLAVFPNLTQEELPECDAARLTEVDSLAGVTLIALINEQFSVNLDMDDLIRLGSFRAICQYLYEKTLSGMPHQDQGVL